MLKLIAVNPELRKGASLMVRLQDGVRRLRALELNDVVTAPEELRLERPDDVPPLAVLRDPRFIYFRLVSVGPDGVPLYQQVVHAPSAGVE